jgi:cytochrome c
MKKIILLGMILLAISCKKQEAEPFGKQEASATTSSEGQPATVQTPEEIGKAIYNGKGTCAACHKENEKLIGPSLKDIATIYKDKKASIVTFLKGESDAIVDPSQAAVMQPNLVLTKKMTDEELKGLEAYIYSIK